MRPSYDDVHHMMVKSSARFYTKQRRRSCGLRQPERRIRIKRLQCNGIHPSSSGKIDLRISSSCTCIRNEAPPNWKVEWAAQSLIHSIVVFTQLSTSFLTLNVLPGMSLSIYSSCVY
ncbi:unnamed protein product [Protopolystoma xenopodis]|uniref:Uncharacterized protein n=1 Tax=Protopolystoma xenopodis TaxID=117903 RepID=A0A3S5FEN5_9PLAT|nr:unnamed protein product [Protopolystoma xenopodis]